MPVPDLSKLTETELLSLVHSVLAKPGNLTKVDELDLRIINQELKRRNDDAAIQINAIETVRPDGYQQRKQKRCQAKECGHRIKIRSYSMQPTQSYGVRET